MAPSIDDEKKAAAHLAKVNSIRHKIGLLPLSKIGVAAPLRFTTSISSKKRCSFELRRHYLEERKDDEPPPPPGSWMSSLNSTSSPTMLAELNRRDNCGSGGQKGMVFDSVRLSEGQGQGGIGGQGRGCGQNAVRGRAGEDQGRGGGVQATAERAISGQGWGCGQNAVRGRAGEDQGRGGGRTGTHSEYIVPSSIGISTPPTPPDYIIEQDRQDTVVVPSSMGINTPPPAVLLELDKRDGVDRAPSKVKKKKQERVRRNRRHRCFRLMEEKYYVST